MTIAELEARSGMTRANIRFYESEGFLSPARRENGYRDYSEADLELLLRLELPSAAVTCELNGGLGSELELLMTIELL